MNVCGSAWLGVGVLTIGRWMPLVSPVIAIRNLSLLGAEVFWNVLMLRRVHGAVKRKKELKSRKDDKHN